MIVTLHLLKNSSKINKDIFRYLDANIDILNRSGVLFKFNVVSKKTKPPGIPTLPAVDYNGQLFTDNIVDVITSLIKVAPAATKKVSYEDMINEDRRRDLSFEAFANDKDDGTEDTGLGSAAFVQRLNEEANKRSAMHSRHGGMSHGSGGPGMPYGGGGGGGYGGQSMPYANHGGQSMPNSGGYGGGQGMPYGGGGHGGSRMPYGGRKDNVGMMQPPSLDNDDIMLNRMFEETE